MIKAPSPIIVIALFIRPSPRITILADWVKFTNIEPINITLKYLIPNAFISPVAPIKSKKYGPRSIPPIVIIVEKKITQ